MQPKMKLYGGAAGGAMQPKKKEKIVWEPTERQAEFLSASEFEVLYGGAAGGGKTDGLLIDALGIQHGAWEKRAYQAIILRRTYPDLKDIIDRSQEIYKEFHPGAKYDKTSHVWTFPSGARIEFGHIQRDIDRLRYRGRAFQYVGWEELTLWPTSAPYLYLMSRVRSSDSSIPLYVRATTNPDGPGFAWVKKHWRIANDGTATRFEVELFDVENGNKRIRSRRFIPAKLSDNKHLGDDYRTNLLLLSEEEQRALLLGRWDTPQIKGAYYTKEMDEARSSGRICKVPHVPSLPVDSFWDLGLSKASGTTAIWLHQHVAMQNRFIKCVEGDDKPLSFYGKWLLDQPYVYGTHYLPHDADHRRLGKDDVRSWKEMLEELLPGHKFEIVPRVDDVSVGIQMTKDRFSSCYFDQEGCADGIAALENYRREWDEQLQVYRQKPLHDWASNYADSFRQFGQGWQPSPGRSKTPRQRASWRTV